MDEQALRHEIKVAFEYSYLHDDWVTPLEEALEGVTAEQALRRPRPNSKGIWEIVLHLAMWNENIVDRIRTGQPTRATEEHWPPLPPTPDEAAWEAAKKRLWDSLESMRVAIEAAPMEKIVGMHYGLGDLFCRFNHLAYHGGQIVKLRECFDF